MVRIIQSIATKGPFSFVLSYTQFNDLYNLLIKWKISIRFKETDKYETYFFKLYTNRIPTRLE